MIKKGIFTKWVHQIKKVKAPPKPKKSFQKKMLLKFIIYAKNALRLTQIGFIDLFGSTRKLAAKKTSDINYALSFLVTLGFKLLTKLKNLRNSSPLTQ